MAQIQMIEGFHLRSRSGLGNIWTGEGRAADPESYRQGRNYGIAVGAGAVGVAWAVAFMMYRRRPDGG